MRPLTVSVRLMADLLEQPYGNLIDQLRTRSNR